MRIKMSCAALIIAAFFWNGVVVPAQTTQSNGERIRLLRAEIKKREAVEVPDDLKELNRSKLNERRAELRTLLLVEISSLQKYKSQLGPLTITPEEIQTADNSIRGYRTELRKLGEAMQRDLASESGELPSSDSLKSAADQNHSLGSPTPPDSPTVTMIATGASTGTAVTETSGPESLLANGVSRPALANTSPGSVPEPARSTSSPTSANSVPGSIPPMAQPPVATNQTAACTAAKAADQKKGFSEVDRIICGLADDIIVHRSEPNKGKGLILRSTDLFKIIKILIAKKQTPGFLVDAEETRLDKQVGATSNSSGTALVAKGGAPAILGFAVENGGLTQTVNGSVITFRGNPVGLINALSNKGFVPSVKADQKDPILNFLKKTSFAFTFNTDRGSQPGVFTATKQQLSSVSARIEFINKRRPELYIKDWEDFLGTKAQKLANILNQSQLLRSDTPQDEWKDQALQAWFATTQAALSKAADADVYTVLQASLDKLPVKDISPDTVLTLGGIENALEEYVGGRDELLKKINSGTVVTFDYLNKREVNAPDTSQFMLIAEKGIRSGHADFTFNGSLTMFNNLGALRNFVVMNPTLPKARRVRDFQFSGQVDIPFGRVQDFGKFVFFAAGRYERLLENASTDFGMILPQTKGDIGNLQMGLKVPIKGTGFKIPISVTFANRTELVKERTIRGNFGFTLDLDTLLAKFKPF